MTRRAALYLRVSDPNSRDTDETQGLQVQEDACRAYARTAGLPVGEVFLDRITGTSEQRAGFGQLLAQAEHYTDLIVYATDRLARHPRAGYALIETAQQAGLTIHTAIEGMVDLADDAGAMNTGMRLVFADAERRRIIRRLMGGKLARMRGRPDLGIPGRPVKRLNAYGWKNDVVEPTEARWVEWIYRRSLEVGVHTLVRELAQQGVPSPTGMPGWDPSVLVEMLRLSSYRGEWVFGRHRQDRPAQQSPVSAPCPRIVSDELWYAAQRAMDARTKGKGRRGRRLDILPLQGRVSCGVCGRSMIGHRPKRDGPRAYYVCGDNRNAPHKRLGCTHRTHYPAPQIHEEVLNWLRQLAQDPARLAQHLPAPQVQDHDSAPQLAELDARLRRVTAAYEDGVDTLQEYREKKGRIEGQRHLVLTAPPTVVAGVTLEQAGDVLRRALALPALHETVALLGLRLTLAPGGGLSISLDPVI